LPACDFFFQGREPRVIGKSATPPQAGADIRPAFSKTRPEIEVQAVRALPGVIFVAVCLTQAGCNSTGRNKGAETARAPNTPFMGAPSSPAVPPAAAADARPPADDSGGSANLASGGPGPNKTSGVLAGRVVDEYNRLKPSAIIQVIDLDAGRDEGAPLKVLANKEGYFDIDGLQGGHSYRLVASIKDGARVLFGTTRVVAPNVRVVIFLNDERPVAPAGAAAPASTPQPSDGTPAGSSIPGASIGAPIKTPGPGVTTPLPSADGGSAAPGLPPPVSTGDPSLIADKGARDVQDGFSRGVPANIEGPGREPREKPPIEYTPPSPPGSTGESGTTTPLPPSAAPYAAPPSPSVSAPVDSSRRVPFCLKTGNRVDNFALFDSDGNIWELSKQRKGRVVLVDFWFSRCGPCLGAIPHLVELQKKYGAWGLQIVGIARENGSLEERQQAVRPVRARYHINYPLLLTGGSTGPCPVLTSFAVQEFPTVVLLDRSGNIVFRTKRGQGLDEQACYDLEMEIRRQLGLR
jgi:thiol-disulfide isomerase/thioredoxin